MLRSFRASFRAFPLQAPNHVTTGMIHEVSIESFVPGAYTIPQISSSRSNEKKRIIRGYPVNFVGLCALTAVMACDVGVISALAASAGMGSLVAEAAVITALLVAGLTLLG